MGYVPALKLVRWETNPLDRISKQVPDPTDYTAPAIGDLVMNDGNPNTTLGVATIKLALSGSGRVFKGVTQSDSIAANTTVPPQGIGSGSTSMGGQPATMLQVPHTNTNLGVNSRYGNSSPASTVDMIRPAGGDLWRMIPLGWRGQASDVGGPTFKISDFGSTFAVVQSRVGAPYDISNAPSSTLASADLTIVAGVGGLQFNVASGTGFKAGQYVTLTGVDASTTLPITAHLLLTVVSTNAITATFLAAGGDCAVGSVFDYTGGSIATTMVLTLGVTIYAAYTANYPLFTIASVNPDGTLVVRLDNTYLTV